MSVAPYNALAIRGTRGPPCVVPAMVNVQGLPYVILDSMPPTGE